MPEWGRVGGYESARRRAEGSWESAMRCGAAARAHARAQAAPQPPKTRAAQQSQPHAPVALHRHVVLEGQHELRGGHRAARCRRGCGCSGGGGWSTRLEHAAGRARARALRGAQLQQRLAPPARSACALPAALPGCMGTAQGIAQARAQAPLKKLTEKVARHPVVLPLHLEVVRQPPAVHKDVCGSQGGSAGWGRVGGRVGHAEQRVGVFDGNGLPCVSTSTPTPPA